MALSWPNAIIITWVNGLEPFVYSLWDNGFKVVKSGNILPLECCYRHFSFWISAVSTHSQILQVKNFMMTQEGREQFRSFKHTEIHRSRIDPDSSFPTLPSLLITYNPFPITPAHRRCSLPAYNDPVLCALPRSGELTSRYSPGWPCVGYRWETHTPSLRDLKC